ncbi:hypothetical protein QG516_13850 [Pedobacter gandavensis]|uniref:HYC_CC_PP family protein n=1 Tax=Pedobacter TaxID=84567 RepID=UPI001C99AD96|nr:MULTISPECIES: hypothetical protein [Pedobacter]WGQ07651.1 hypothetical protein QG516_13850 [Pedobacter gandavensis]
MKRLLSFFLCLLFLIVSTGFTTSAHICKGVKQEMRLFSKEHQDQVCPVCALKNKQKTKKDNCCKHEKEQVKLADKVQKIAQQENLLKFTGEAVLYLHPANTTIWDHKIETLKTDNFYFSTPLKQPPFYILHCVYLI